MAEYKGRKVTLNKPRRISKGKPVYGKKSKEVFVKNKNGRVVRVTFGDPNLSVKSHRPARKKSYCSRSKGQGNLTDKTKANYWSRREWKC